MFSKLLVCYVFLIFLGRATICYGEVSHFPLNEETIIPSRDVSYINYIWNYGDRSMDLVGIRIPSETGTASFMIDPKGERLTLEIREFRTQDGQWPAYLVSADEKPFAFRCRRYDETGPSSAFIDLPDSDRTAPVKITISNIAPTPLCLSEVYLYSDIEKAVQDAGLHVPMYVGPTIRGITRTPVERLVEIRGLIPDVEHIKPKIVLSTVPLAQLVPESNAAWLDNVLGKCFDAKIPVELQLNTWWAGTPFGPDGRGGRWTDVEYQQVTYEPKTGEYGLSLPNRWSSVPWLTMRHPHFNAFKIRMFKTMGQLLRERWDRYESKEFMPILDLITDNEVTYWAGGMAGTSVTAQADFNPTMIAAAKDQGIELNPVDGLSEEEIEFLKNTILYYNREMIDGLLEGLGNTPLRDRIYTHTWDKGSVFDNAIQAYEAGVLQKVRFGVESNQHQSEAIPKLEIVRELGLPASINAELGGDTGPALHVPLAFALGCTQASLFNASDALLKDTKEYVESGWPSYEPVAWNKQLFVADFSKPEASWKDYFSSEQVELHMGITRETGMLMGKQVGESNFTRLHFTARELLDKDTFNRLSLFYKMRAFVSGRKDDDAYLSVRVGICPDKLREMERFANTGGLFRTNVSDIVKGATEIYIEMEFHPKGLAGWVGVFQFAIEEPWEEEALLTCNRSYRADRLRAESLMVAWRADAYWTLRRCEESSCSPDELSRLRQFYDDCNYLEAFEQGQTILDENREDTYIPYTPPAPDRVERGILSALNQDTVAFEPYDEGVRDRKLPLAADAKLLLILNGEQRGLSDGAKKGDDVQVTVKDSQALKVVVSRGEAESVVKQFKPLTPFNMPALKLEGFDELSLDGKASVHQSSGKPLKGSFPYVLGVEYFKPGETVAIRWNPYTEKIVEARYIEQQ